MTPELRSACELVFQHHKLSGHRIKWDKNVFRGQISIGLSAMAKETLVKKNIILLPPKSKKVFTELNPAVAAADSFEEAAKMIETKIPEVNAPAYDAETYITNHVFGFAAKPPARNSQNRPEVKHALRMNDGQINWWMRPAYLYLVWPACGLAAGVLISLLMDFVYTELFLNSK